jgi:hypothetical protein
MSMLVITLARQKAIKAVKREYQDRGLKPAYIQWSVIRAAADEYLGGHPELFEEVKESVRKVPGLRTLYEKEQRELARKRR